MKARKLLKYGVNHQQVLAELDKALKKRTRPILRVFDVVTGKQVSEARSKTPDLSMCKKNRWYEVKFDDGN